MGEVYLAVDQRLGSAVALKRTFFSDDEMLGNAFEREARTLARLRHPVLPKVSDHFTENGTQYLAMEHISGDDLSKRLAVTHKPFPLSWVLFWTDQLLDALAYLHNYEPPIIHRDIKPQNLKLTDENHIVLLDFGLAKNSINTRVTSTGGSSLVGYTPHYAPMEQVRGTGTDPRSDLYSLSATVYQLLTNTVPLDALTRADAVLSSSPDPCKPINEVNAEIPKSIADVIQKGMALSMDKRYTDARQMQKALREAYAGIQSAMAAQTIAFNTGEVQNSPPSQQATDVLSAGSQISSQGSFSANTGEAPTSTIPNNYSTAENFSSHNDFDITMRDNGDSFGMKTEVMPADQLPRAEDYAAAPIEDYAAFPRSEKEFEDEDFSPKKEEEFDPSSTIPLMNFGTENKAPATREYSQPHIEPEENYTPQENYASDQPYSGGETYLPQQPDYQQQSAYQQQSNYQPQEEFQPAEEEYQYAEQELPPPPVQTAAPPKSGGKGLLIAGILGVLAVLAIGAAGIGWYILKPSVATTVTPTPTPFVEPTATATPVPTVQPTPEPTVEANSNSNTVNSEVANSNSTIDNTNKKAVVPTDDTRGQNDKTVQPTPVRATPTPRVVVNTPPQRTPPPVKTPAPQKTPAKSDRTDILQ